MFLYGQVKPGPDRTGGLHPLRGSGQASRGPGLGPGRLPGSHGHSGNPFYSSGGYGYSGEHTPTGGGLSSIASLFLLLYLFFEVMKLASQN
jgi:hypothetical protein